MVIDAAEPEIVTEIYPETVSKRKLPVNFSEDHRALFDLDLERSIPPSRLIRLRNVHVSREGIFFTGTKILPESFAFAWIAREWKVRSVLKFFATNYFFRRRRHVDKEVLWISDYWSTAYFHWLTDALTRLFAIRDRLNVQTLMLPAGYETLDFVTSSLKAFGVNNVNFIGPKEALECCSVLVPTHTAPSGHYNDQAIRGVRRVLLSAFADADQGLGERIYISRRQAEKRRIVNENDLNPILANFGFQTICPEDFSFEQQVSICSRAKYVVSNHGAGLTNALFMKEGGCLLELRHQEDRHRNCFFVMSSTLNLNYFYQRCRPREPDADPHYADLIVDPEAFETTLRLMLS